MQQWIIQVLAYLVCLFAHQTSGSVPHVLEIGVGSGYNLSFLPEKCKLSCLDPNPEFQKYVVQFLRDYPGVHLEQFSAGFAENMSQFETNTFDAVLCTFVLCSVRDPVKVVSEIKRVLKPVSLSTTFLVQLTRQCSLLCVKFCIF